MIGISELVILAAVAAVIFAVAWTFIRPRRASAAGPCCAGCGYSVHGLTGFTCPECGRDLREVGILTPHTAARRASFAASAGWFTAALAFLGLLFVRGVSELSPEIGRSEHTYSFGSPASRAYGGVDVKAVGRSWGGTPRRVSVTLEFRPARGSERAIRPAGPLQVDPRTGGYSYVDAVGTRVGAPAGFGPDVVRAWLAALGVPADNERVRAEATRLAGTARVIGRGPRIGVVGMGMSSSSSNGNDPQFDSVVDTQRLTIDVPPWVPVGAILLSVAVWLAGLRYLWLMTRRPHA